MARPPARRSPCWNAPPTGKYELAGAAPGPAPTEGSDTFTLAPAVSRVPTPTPSDALVAALSLSPALAATVPSSDNKLFKQFIKAYLEAQVSSRTKVDPEPRKQPLKAQFPDLYYGNSHMDCYRFCQQCDNHFKTARAKGPNKTLFATLFLRGSVIQRWL